MKLNGNLVDLIFCVVCSCLIMIYSVQSCGRTQRTPRYFAPLSYNRRSCRAEFFASSLADALRVRIKRKFTCEHPQIHFKPKPFQSRIAEPECTPAGKADHYLSSPRGGITPLPTSHMTKPHIQIITCSETRVKPPLSIARNHMQLNSRT